MVFCNGFNENQQGPLDCECHEVGAGPLGCQDCGSDNVDLEPEVRPSLPASQFPFSRALRGTSARPEALAPLHFHLPHVFTCTQLFPVCLVLPRKPRVDSFIGNWPSSESEARGIAVSFTTRSKAKEEEGNEKGSGWKEPSGPVSRALQSSGRSIRKSLSYKLVFCSLQW